MDATNRNTALCSALVDELVRAGVEHACVCPGSRSAPLALAFWNDQRIKTWSIVDERSAGFFALGIGQQTGRPAAVVTTSGTAGANVHPAVAESSYARVPLIVITADRPPELRDRGAGQAIDQIKLFGSAVRWFCELGNIDADDDGLLHFRSTGSRAVAEAEGPAPGPVHLNVPLREPLAPESAPYEVEVTRELARSGRPAGLPLTTVERPPAAPDDSLRRGVRADDPRPPARRDPRRPPARPRAGRADGGTVGGERLPDPGRADLAASRRAARERRCDRRL